MNRARALNYMREAELDALVAATPVNVRYFSGFQIWLDPILKEYMVVPGGSSNLGVFQAFALLPLEGDPALIVHAALVANALDSWIVDVYAYGSRNFDEPNQPSSLNERQRRVFDAIATARPTAVGALAAALEDRRLTGCRIGLDADGLTTSVADELTATLEDTVFSNCSNLIRLVRMVKTDSELELLARAATVAEEAAMEAFTAATPDRPMSELVGIFRAQVAQRGGSVAHCAYGVAGLSLATDAAYVLSANDCFAVDFGAIWNGYLSDSAVTVSVSTMAPQLLDKYEALSTCVQAGINALRPGATASQIQAEMANALEDIPIRVEGPTGHGFGLEIRDYPVLIPDNGLRIRDDCVDVRSDIPIESNMVLNLEVSAFLPGVASLEVERTAVVTEDGSRELIDQPRSHPLVSER